MSKAVVIIPARGGSKRLKRKNIMSFHGMPLIAHSIIYAQKFPNLIERIIVSTEDAEIKTIAKQYGAEILDRPPELAADHSSTLEVLQHALGVLPNSLEYFITLQPTNPLRPTSLLADCLNKLTESSAKSLFSISPAPKKIGTLNSTANFIPITYDVGCRSQDISDIYFENGLIYITHRELIQQGIIFDKSSLTYIVDAHYGHCDIDTEYDYHYGLYLFEKYKNSMQQKN